MGELFERIFSSYKNAIGAEISREDLVTAPVTTLEEKRHRRAERQRYSKGLTPLIRAWLLAAGFSLPVRVVSPLFVWAKPRVIEGSTIEEIAPGVWISESGDAKQSPFKIQRKGRIWTCGCPKWAKQRGRDCQHIKFLKGLSNIGEGAPYKHSRRIALPRIIYPAGTPTEATRRQNARTKQECRVPELLAELCRLAEPMEQETRKRGQPPVPAVARAYALVVKAMLGGFSYPTVINYLRNDPNAHALGVFKTAELKLHRNSLCQWAADPDVTLVLRSMFPRIAMVVRDIETVALVDGTARAVTQTGDYFEWKYGHGPRLRPATEYLKEHLLVGRRTGMILSIEFSSNSGRGSADVVHLRTNLETAIASCPGIVMVVGDKVYGSSIGNGRWCEGKGILLVSRARSNETRSSKKWAQSQRDLAALERDDPEQFSHLFYNQRSIVEVQPGRSKRNQRHRRLRRRFTDPVVVSIPHADDHEEQTLTNLPQEALRAIVDLQERALGIARLNEGLAIAIRDNLCTLVVLEELHDQTVRFVPGFTFRPISTKELTEAELQPEAKEA